jgi:Transposase DDE domain
MSFLPADWRRLARKTDALKGLRQNKSAEDCLRTLLIHLACGYSLRDTALRAREAGLANLSDVALLKRLRKSEQWLYELCRQLFEETHLNVPESASVRRLRLVDATHVKEPGKMGTQWRIDYSLSWPSLRCDYLRITHSRGQGHGESLSTLPVKSGDCLLAERGYSTAHGIDQVVSHKADVIVRLNPQGIQLALHKLQKKVTKNGLALEPDTVLFSGYVLVFSTLSEVEFEPQIILEWYRLRWQIELVFKRFKQIAHLGHLPKNDPQGARAWLYGKLFVALLVEKLLAHANSVSPWGYPLPIQHSP